MKKILSLMLFSLMSCLLIGKSTSVFAVPGGPISMEEHKAFISSLEEDAKKDVTNEMVEDFKKTKLYKDTLLNEAKRISWEKSEKKRIAEKAEKDAKYKRLQEILKDLQDMGDNKKDLSPQQALGLANEGLAIENMPLLHFYKSNFLIRTGKPQEGDKEIMDINPNDGKMIEKYYVFLARANFRDPAKQLEIFTEGINNASSLPVCFGLIKDKALLNKQLGNEKEYLEARKTLLIFKRMEQLGMIKLSN